MGESEDLSSQDGLYKPREAKHARMPKGLFFFSSPVQSQREQRRGKGLIFSEFFFLSTPLFYGAGDHKTGAAAADSQGAASTDEVVEQWF